MSCNCSVTALSCCPEKNYVQDKVCSPWSGTVVAATVLVTFYNNNISQNIVGTGFIKYDTGPGPITVLILDSANNQIDSLTISPGTSVAFTYRHFDRIQTTLPATPAGTYQGEFCITTRYPIT
ncbi:hypothetical protein COI93_18460 [Bacillus cereus]|uniref:Endospore appendages core domain-containing protein n=1 Tax=Bacillus cereus TaxID=1396 RepID=A0A2B0LU55_BACCE|nr:hypothetical protein COI93_18460 [Bacillus cereus]